MWCFSSPSGATRLGRRSRKSATGENDSAVHCQQQQYRGWKKTTSRCVSSCCVASYHCHLYPHPENDEERADVLDSLKTRIQDLNNVGFALTSINNSKHKI